MRRAALTGLFAILSMVALSPPAQARGSHILSESKPYGDPGLIDLSVTGVQYDMRSGSVSIRGTFVCNAPNVDPEGLDVFGRQTRGKTTTVGIADSLPLPCDSTFNTVIPVQSGQGFRPGRATLEATGTGCGALNCARETVRVEVVLVPEPRH